MRLRLIYSTETVEKPILATTILKTGIPVNILEAKVNAKGGELIISIPAEGKELEKMIRMFQEAGVRVELITRTLQIDQNKCINCGACISPCPTRAIRFKPDWTIEFDENRCIACKVCINVCPMKAITPL